MQSTRPDRMSLFFFTLCLADPDADHLTQYADVLRWAAGRTLGKRPVHVIDWVTLPGTLHTIWQMPQGDLDYARRWGEIKRRFAQGLPTGLAGQAGLWQPDVCAQAIHSAAELRLHRAFCRHAPVRAGLVRHPEDWPFASFSAQHQAAAQALGEPA